MLRPAVTAQIPHDPTAFTEGLEFDGPALYESTGQLGHSQLRQLDPTTGAVVRAAPLPPDVFGEGITIVGAQIWQLTWRNGFAIEWDKASFTPLRRVRFQGEGWGLCHDGKRLIRSNGTDKLRLDDPMSFAETGSASIIYQGRPLAGFNEGLGEPLSDRSDRPHRSRDGQGQRCGGRGPAARRQSPRTRRCAQRYCVPGGRAGPLFASESLSRRHWSSGSSPLLRHHRPEGLLSAMARTP